LQNRRDAGSSYEPRRTSKAPQQRAHLQNLADVRDPVANAPASWTAAVLRRFRRATGLGIRTVHGSRFRFFASIGSMNLGSLPLLPTGWPLLSICAVDVNLRADDD
jgi:hypothetical protein